MAVTEYILQFFCAAVATVCFALLFGVPVRYFFSCGIIGGTGWLLYLLVKPLSSAAIATFAAMLTVALMSRGFAVLNRCPTTIFLIAGLIPLVPGAGIYRAAYYAVNGQITLASYIAFDAIKAAVAIVLGIVLAFELPERLFHIGINKLNNKNYSKEQSGDMSR